MPMGSWPPTRSKGEQMPIQGYMYPGEDIEQGYWTRVLNGGIERGYWTGVLNGGYWTMGTLLFNRVLNGVLNGISARACSIPKRFDSQPYVKCLSDFFCGLCGPAAAPLIAFGKTLASDISAFKLQPPLCNYSHSFAMTFKFVVAPRK